MVLPLLNIPAEGVDFLPAKYSPFWASQVIYRKAACSLWVPHGRAGARGPSYTVGAAADNPIFHNVMNRPEETHPCRVEIERWKLLCTATLCNSTSTTRIPYNVCAKLWRTKQRTIFKFVKFYPPILLSLMSEQTYAAEKNKKRGNKIRLLGNWQQQQQLLARLTNWGSS